MSFQFGFFVAFYSLLSRTYTDSRTNLFDEIHDTFMYPVTLLLAYIVRARATLHFIAHV